MISTIVPKDIQEYARNNFEEMLSIWRLTDASFEFVPSNDDSVDCSYYREWSVTFEKDIIDKTKWRNMSHV